MNLHSKYDNSEMRAIALELIPISCFPSGIPWWPWYSTVSKQAVSVLNFYFV